MSEDLVTRAERMAQTYSAFLPAEHSLFELDSGEVIAAWQNDDGGSAVMHFPNMAFFIHLMENSYYEKTQSSGNPNRG